MPTKVHKFHQSAARFQRFFILLRKIAPNPRGNYGYLNLFMYLCSQIHTRMRKPIITSILLSFALTVFASPLDDEATLPTSTPEADSIMAYYTQCLEELVARQANTTSTTSVPSPYFFHLFGPGTLYTGALSQNMSMNTDEPAPNNLPTLGQTGDHQLLLNEIINEQLNRAYTMRPDLFATTQADLMSTTKLRTDLAQKVEEEQLEDREVIEDVEEIFEEDSNFSNDDEALAAMEFYDSPDSVE